MRSSISEDPSLGAVRVDNFKYQFHDQPDGWPGPKVETDTPVIYNIRQDPFERTPILNFAQGSPAWFNEFFGREGWRSREDCDRVSADAGRSH